MPSTWCWVGADDKLPRRVRAVYRNDPAQLRHQLDLSDWQLDFALPAEAFAFSIPATAKRIEFARPDPIVTEGIRPPPKRKSTKSK
jgi:outer membrane lipoprotein-sorting protein